MARSIADVQADIVKLQSLWSTATTHYEARKAALAAEVDNYVATHQGAADQHAAEIQAANILKAKLVPAVAAVETVNTFLLTEPWYQRLVANLKRNARWYVYGVGLLGMVYVALHIHK